MKVEQALRLLPSLETLLPIRSLLLSSAQSDERTVWGSSGVYRTVGKRDVETTELRQKLGPVLKQVARNMADSCEAFINTLQCVEEGDPVGAVAHVLRAGRLGESTGRLEHARAWYTVGLTIAGELPGRGPEIEALVSLGRVSRELGDFEQAARQYQRCLALAETASDWVAALDACEGLGSIALDQDPGGEAARAWFTRGLRVAESIGNERWIGRLHLQLGESAYRTGEWTVASDELRSARDRFETIADAREMARALALQGQLNAGFGEAEQAAASYREALAWTLRAEPDTALEVSIRINFAKLYLDAGSYLEAEEEFRRAEQLAIAKNLVPQLVQIYTLMGSTRGRQGDEAGFVFFEQAIELMRMLDRSPLVEAQVCFEYGVFENRVARPDESRAYLERAREIFESIGANRDLERVQAELHRVSA